MHDQVNDWTSASDFREQITRDALLYPFGGIAYIADNSEGKPINLFRLTLSTYLPDNECNAIVGTLMSVPPLLTEPSAWTGTIR